MIRSYVKTGKSNRPQVKTVLNSGSIPKTNINTYVIQSARGRHLPAPDTSAQRGFDNPVKMITSLPAILGLAFENIDEKLHFARRLSKFGVDGVKLAELFPALLGYNIRRLRLLARVVFAVIGGDEKFFLALVTKRQDAVVSGLLMQKQPSKSGVMRAARDRKNREENLAVIQSHARASKIAQAYLRYTPG